ncbi:MAG: globin domain-containing protein [Vicinamibacteria bacterium]
MKVVRNLLREIEIEESEEEIHRKMAMTGYLRFQAMGIEGERKFFAKFYENLFTVMPEVESHFQSIDMERQHRIVNGALHTLLDFRPDSRMARANLEVLASRHANLGLTERHYALFLDALIQTIRELGENDPALLAAWRSALAPGIEFMWKCQEKKAAISRPAAPPKSAGKRAKSSASSPRPSPRA